MRLVTDEELRILGLTEGARRKLITELFMIPDHAKTFPRSLNKNRYGWRLKTGVARLQARVILVTAVVVVTTFRPCRYDKLNEAIRSGEAPYIPPDEPGRVPPSHQRQQAILEGGVAPEATSLP